MKPTFIGLGAQKCASTWLYRLLATHPQIRLAAVKELDFFSYRFDHGYQWYERHFRGAEGAREMGEVSPSYFHDPCVPRRVRDYCPEVKLLVTLREPVERAISNHKHEVRMGHFAGDDLSFEAGLANNPMYLEQGRYGKHLANWLTCFPRERMFVALMEEIRDQPERVARELFQFLGVDDSHRSDALGERFNASFATRSHGLTRLKDRVYQLSRSPGMGWLWSTASGIGARDVYRRVNILDSDAVIPPVRPSTVRELKEEFSGDIGQLESLLGRSLSHWRCADEVVDNGEKLSGGRQG